MSAETQQPPGPVAANEMERGPVGRVGFGLALSIIGPSGAIAGSIAVLIPARLTEIDPDGKTAALGVVTLIGAIAAILAGVLFGGLSDATRSRFGSRAPWIVGGAIASGATMVGLCQASTVTGILLWWTLFQCAANAVVAALTAVIADRVHVSQRGVVSTYFGVGVLLASTIGSLVGAHFLLHPSTGFLTLGVLAVVLPIAFVFIARDRSNKSDARGSFTTKQFVSAFALPKAAPDFYWALVGRLVIMLGYYMISSYQVFIITDYIHLSPEAASGLISTNTLLSLAGAGVGILLSGPISDRIGSRKIPISVGAALFVVAIAFPLMWPSATAMMLFAGIGGLGFGVYYAVDTAVMADVLPNEGSRAKDLGILNVANGGGQALAPVVASGLVAVAFPLVFVVAIVAVILGGAAIFPIKKIR